MLFYSNETSLEDRFIRIFVYMIFLVGCTTAAALIWFDTFNTFVRIDQTWKSTAKRGGTHQRQARGHRTRDRSANLGISSERRASIQSIPSRSEPSTDTSVRYEPEIKQYRRVIVQDAGTLLADKTRVLLAGLKALDHDTVCRKKNNDAWPCGKQARQSLRRLIRSRSVHCTIVERLTEDSFTGQCTVGMRNINQWVVRQGWAKPSASALATYQQALEDAKREQNGIWKYAHFIQQH